MAGRKLALHFTEPPQHAVQFRLTPQLKQALVEAAANGEMSSMRFTEGAGVRDSCRSPRTPWEAIPALLHQSLE
jgi:hypothetical protein